MVDHHQPVEGSSTASTCASAPPKSSACSPPSIVIALVPWATMSLSVVSVERWMSSVWTGSTRWKVEEWLLGIFWEWWCKVAQVTSTNLYWIQRLNGWSNRSCRVLTICLHDRLHVVPSLRSVSVCERLSCLCLLRPSVFWTRTLLASSRRRKCRRPTMCLSTLRCKAEKPHGRTTWSQKSPQLASLTTSTTSYYHPHPHQKHQRQEEYKKQCQ